MFHKFGLGINFNFSLFDRRMSEFFISVKAEGQALELTGPALLEYVRSRQKEESERLENLERLQLASRKDEALETKRIEAENIALKLRLEADQRANTGKIEAEQRANTERLEGEKRAKAE